jgi:hypothetical protein
VSSFFLGACAPSNGFLNECYSTLQASPVLAAAADAVLVAHHIPKLCSLLVTALARLHVQNPAQRSSLEAGSTRAKKGGEERKKVRSSVWFYLSILSSSRRRESALGVGRCGREIFVLATCPLQFAKAGSAATLPLPQQEKNTMTN